MPLYTATSPHCSLLLAVQHSYNGTLSGPVFASNPLVVTLSASTDGIIATDHQLVTSRTSTYLIQHLRKNALRLGIECVSNIVASKDGSKPMFTITLSLGRTADVYNSCATLLQALHLDYVWKTAVDDTRSSDIDHHPFAQKLTLPLETLLDEVVTRFVDKGLVRKYPFVFGDWARQFHRETVYFLPILDSITSITKRSSNLTFSSQVKSCLKLLKGRIASGFNSAKNSETTLDTESAFFLAMLQIHKQGLRPTSFEGGHRYILDADEEFIEPTSQENVPPDYDQPEDLTLDRDQYDTTFHSEELLPFSYGNNRDHPNQDNTGWVAVDMDVDQAIIDESKRSLVLPQPVADLDLDDFCEDFIGIPTRSSMFTPYHGLQPPPIFRNQNTCSMTGVDPEGKTFAQILVFEDLEESYQRIGFIQNILLVNQNPKQGESDDVGTSKISTSNPNHMALLLWGSQIGSALVPTMETSQALDLNKHVPTQDLGRIKETEPSTEDHLCFEGKTGDILSDFSQSEEHPDDTGLDSINEEDTIMGLTNQYRMCHENIELEEMEIIDSGNELTFDSDDDQTIWIRGVGQVDDWLVDEKEDTFMELDSGS